MRAFARTVALFVLVPFALLGSGAILGLAWQHLTLGDWIMAALLAAPVIALVWLTVTNSRLVGEPRR